MKTFYKILGVGLLVATTNNFVWFALTFWAYLTTKSVISTSIVAGLWLAASAVSSIWFGSIVDHNKKKVAMLGSSIATFVFFGLGLILFYTNPESAFASVGSVRFWAFALLLLSGVIVGSIYAIAIPTLVVLLIPEDKRDKANGMFGTVMGISFAITSVASGLVLAFGGMKMVMLVAVIATALAIIYLSFVSIPEDKVLAKTETGGQKIDLKGTFAAVKAIPGLFALIFYTTINNLLGGVFMALMDAYGLTLVSVQVWGILWGFLSFGFIIGGLYIAKYGLGKSPLKTLFRINMVIWTVCIFFTIQPSIVLLVAGCLIWLIMVPFIEATEQTIFQKVVPPERLGRVFGFAHSIEQGASPVTAFVIGPITQLVFIPFMTTGKGVDLIGDWFGTGPGRGMALVFVFAGIIGLIITILAKRIKSYKILAAKYAEPSAEPEPGALKNVN
jgi:MFS transporter, DHA3 family, multidrug efflux protein